MALRSIKKAADKIYRDLGATLLGEVVQHHPLSATLAATVRYSLEDPFALQVVLEDLTSTGQRCLGGALPTLSQHPIGQLTFSS